MLRCALQRARWELRKRFRTHQVVTVTLPAQAGRFLKIHKSITPGRILREIHATLKVVTEVPKPVKTGRELSTSRRSEILTAFKLGTSFS